MKRYTYNITKNLSILIISVILCFAMIGCAVVGGTDSGGKESIKDSVKTTEMESSDGDNMSTQEPGDNGKEKLNPLVTEEMWGKVPDAETAKAIFEGYEKLEFADCNNKDGYRRIQASSQNWILKNKEGKTLVCRDGILYGDMPYYSPVSSDGALKVDEHYIYDGGWVFVDDSDELIYYPADTCDSELDISVDVSVEGEYVVWSYDEESGLFKGIVDKLTYLQWQKKLESTPEYMVYLKSGKNVEMVRVTEEEILVCGDGAYYSTVIALTATPPRIVFN